MPPPLAATKEISERLAYVEQKLREYGLDDAEAWQGIFEAVRDLRRSSHGGRR